MELDRVALHMPEPGLMAETLTEQLPAFAACTWLDHTTSTNHDLMAQARAEGLSFGWPRLLGAHHQTHGKGRLGRTWHDTPGQTLMFSCGFALETNHDGLQHLHGLGPLIGLKSVQCLRPLFLEPQRLRIKWPNDLMLDDGKLGGVLIETIIKPNVQFVVIGAGINLSDSQSLSNHLQREVAAMSDAVRPQTNIASIACRLAQAWLQAMGQITLSGFTPFQSGFNELDYLANRDVILMNQNQLVATGVARGVDIDGSLRLETNQGMQRFTVGDVSVRLQPPETSS
jgi:BirA family biotin operon repressor/biotin-[acetyl-CoA-carboxylase] ligase